MELDFDAGVDDMKAGYPVDYQTSQLTGFDDMGLIWKLIEHVF